MNGSLGPHRWSRRLGGHAFDALNWFLTSAPEFSEYFVSACAYLRDIDPQKRMQLLALIARRGTDEARSRLAAVIDDIDEAGRTRLALELGSTPPSAKSVAAQHRSDASNGFIGRSG